MITILQMILAVCVNAIPVGGVVFGGWTPATALTLYWCENLVASLLIALRIDIHRRLTRKQGHYRIETNGAVEFGNVKTKEGSRRRVERRSRAEAGNGRRPTYLGGFLLASLAFSLAHGVFLVAVLVIVVKVRPDPTQLSQGLLWMLAAQFAGFFLDLLRLRNWPFADLKRVADLVLGRVVLIHLALLGGTFLAALSSRPQAFFTVFGFLKTVSDVGGQIPYHPKPGVEAPRWFLWFANRFDKGKHWKTGQDAATWWRETTLAERQRAEEDEQIIEASRRA